MAYPCSFTFMLIMTLVSNSGVIGAFGYDYQEALGKSIMFYEGQRSGRLPSNQRANWRADSALKDGFSQGVDLVGGYYDAGDNVKFGLPMAFTITMLSWSVVEYGYQLASSGQLRYTLDAIKWGTDYLIKAHPEPEVLWGEVGDGFTDHNCWQRPEEMTTSRQAYRVDPSRPGSDLAGETAAAMAAASIAFGRTDGGYANLLLEHAKQLFTFADTHRGKYDSSISVARSFYGSQSGYADELLWSAMWLYEATSEEYYLNYVMENAESLGGTGWAMTEFSWDAKYAGVQVLVSKMLLERRGGDPAVLQKYQSKAEFFLCACLQKNNGYNNNVQRTPGGLMYWQSWNNMQFVTSASFLLSVYSDYLTSARQQLQCSSGSVSPSEMLSLVKSQVDYILGDNPRATSYMVGFGANYPQRVHHRGASIVSYKVNPNFVSCRGGYATWYSRSGGDPNVLVGALVGGPDQDDNYADDRENYEQSEPATYNNGPFVGVLARVHGGGTYNQLYPVNPAPSVPTLPKSPVNPSPVPSPVRGHPHSASILISQRMTSSWNFRGHTYYRYEASVKNNSPSSLQQLILSVTKLYGPVWGLTQSGENAFTFPQWLQSLPSGESLVFVYIHAAPEADISISSSKFV